MLGFDPAIISRSEMCEGSRGTLHATVPQSPKHSTHGLRGLCFGRAWRHQSPYRRSPGAQDQGGLAAACGSSGSDRMNISTDTLSKKSSCGQGCVKLHMITLCGCLQDALALRGSAKAFLEHSLLPPQGLKLRLQGRDFVGTVHGSSRTPAGHARQRCRYTSIERAVGLLLYLLLLHPLLHKCSGVLMTVLQAISNQAAEEGLKSVCKISCFRHILWFVLEALINQLHKASSQRLA
mmetsp:Transcript_105530/g.183525  ORF Transcript_105530/g.183525 Transcript_105530/m.183525 type:complete len:236 (+) Transcript_105530:405-1112(+)